MNNTKKTTGIISIALIFTLLLFAVACSGQIEDKNEGVITFTDALGREVCVQKKPERVAALLGSFADVWMLAGGELCAAAEDAWEDFGLPLEDCTNIGGAHSPSLELLILANPDFVLASASTASNVQMKDTLEDMGITVAYFDVDNFSDYLNMLDICTRITGRYDLYEKNGLELKEEIDGIKASYAEAEIPENERKVLLLRAASGFVKAKGSTGTVLGEMLADIGCVNIADSDEGLLENLSVEAVIREEPYHVFVVTMGSDTEAAMKSFNNLINGNPAWSTLDAVHSGRVHMMDKALFNLKPNDRWAEAYGVLYEKLTKE